MVTQRVWRTGKRRVKRTAWGFSIQAAGKQVRVQDAAWTKEDAQRAEAARVLATTPAPALDTTTLNAYADRWLGQVAGGLAATTLASYRSMLAAHIRPALGHARLGEVDRGRLKALLAAKRAEGSSKNTVRLIKATLSVLLGDAVDDGYLVTNPVQGITRRGRKGPDTITQSDRREKIRPMSAEQLEAFLEATREHQGAWTLFLILADTGVRPGEAFGLQWEDVDLAGQVVTIERSVVRGIVKTTKTATTRTVELTPRLVEALDRWQTAGEAAALLSGREASPWLFTGPDGRAQAINGVQRRFSRVCHRAQLPRFRLYDLRHTYASHALAAGAPITYVAKQLGHANPVMTLRHYAHWIPSPERVWAARLQSARVSRSSAHDRVSTREVSPVV